ncbi:hypothetical protein LSAT2_008066 [Lamellibrachia satsuma]|nr:hypothetical protein LSAT2_008066 [Lamellibrachia satsuma]
MGRNQQQRNYGEADLQEVRAPAKVLRVHKSLEAVELARANGVGLISFPPHKTHRLQPLDKCFFGPLKEYYRQACDYWMTSNTGKRITFYNIAALFGAAYTRACTIDKAVSGFSSCGLWPFNPAVFRDADFAPSLMTDIIEQATPASTMPAVTVPTEIVAPEPFPSSARVKATNLSERVTLPDAVASTSTGRTTPMTTINTFIHGISPLPKLGPGWVNDAHSLQNISRHRHTRIICEKSISN